MNTFIGILIGLVILMLLVIAHEFGHFIMARKNGVNVKEFGIGFPPRLGAWVRKPVETKDKNGNKITRIKWVRLPKSEWQKNQESLVFSINALPIGGFCSMDGESDADTRKGTFGAASFWAKTKILFGGVLMNWLVAAVVLTVLAFTGMPQFIDHQFYLGNDAKIIGGGVTVYEVVEDSPAAKAGFKEGDQIFAVDEQPITIPSDIIEYNSSRAGETITYHIKRSEAVADIQCIQAPCDVGETLVEKELVATLNPEGAEYALGISMDYGQTFIRSTWSAPIVGIGTTLQLTGATFQGVGELLWNLVSGAVRLFSPNSEVREAGKVDIGAATEGVAGPVGIIGVLFPSIAKTGIANLAFLAALISVSLACMNVLPIPALDGGRWLMIAIYRLRHKKLTKETEEKIVSYSFMVLIVLIVVITILDIIKLK